MNTLDELRYKFHNIKEKISLKIESMKKSTTFREDLREQRLSLNNGFFDELREARKFGGVDEEMLFMHDEMMYLQSMFAYYTQGASLEESENEIDYEESRVAFKVGVKRALEEGADVKALYYPIYTDDDEEGMLGFTIIGLLKGYKLFPLFQESSREEDGVPPIDPIFFEIEDILDQTFTIGELATLYYSTLEPDIIAMLIRADADFTVRSCDDPEGVHAFVRIFQKDYEATTEDKMAVLETYKEVYLNKNNKLTEKQRASIPKLMWSCIRESSPHSKDISQEDKEIISLTLSDMIRQKARMDGKKSVVNVPKNHEKS